MSTNTKSPTVDTKSHVKNDGVPRQPHERDEAPDKQSIRPREEMKQAAKDLQQGQVDTDLHGARGVEKTTRPATNTDKKSNLAKD